MAGVRAALIAGTLIVGLAVLPVQAPAHATGSTTTSSRVLACPPAARAGSAALKAEPQRAPRTGSSTASTAHADVTGDGIPDLITSSAGRLLADWGKAPDVGGGIHVIPGGSTFPGMKPAFVTQDTGTISGVGEAGDGFGFSLVTGDFDGDGRADVAVGTPFEEADGVRDAGRVTVLYGTATFPYLEPRGLSDLIQGAHGVPGTPEPDDRFGSSLAAGDFNGDGCSDLAIGDPYEDINGIDNTGAIQVLYGKPAEGLTVNGLQIIENGIAGAAEIYDHFGWGLAAGDVNGDAVDDLALTIQDEVIPNVPETSKGVVLLLKGTTATGLSTTTPPLVTAANAGTAGSLDAITIGKFRPGQYADVIVHATQSNGLPNNSGALVALAGGADGISPTRVTTISQDTTVPAVSGADPAQANDSFGVALATGDVNGDGLDELATSAHGDHTGRGSVSVFYGNSAGVFTQPDFYFTSAAAPISDIRKEDEHFGHGLRIIDIDGDGSPELIVTAPKENGDYKNAVMYVLDLARNGTTTSITSSRRMNRDALYPNSCNADPTVSCFGPGFPIAGSVTGPIELPASGGPWFARRDDKGRSFHPNLDGLPVDHS